MQRGEYAYYKFEFKNLEEKTLVIDVTPISGDPDIVIAYSDHISYPSKENYEVSSMAQGYDSIRITKEMFLENSPDCLKKGRQNLCSIIIGIFTQSEHAIFTILGSIEDFNN